MGREWYHGRKEAKMQGQFLCTPPQRGTTCNPVFLVIRLFWNNDEAPCHLPPEGKPGDVGSDDRHYPGRSNSYGGLCFFHMGIKW